MRQEKEELGCCYTVFSKDDDRDKIANKTKIAPKQLKKSLLTMPLLGFWIMILALISLITVLEANATAKLSLQNLEKAPVKYFDESSMFNTTMNVWFFIVWNLFRQSKNTILFNRQNL